MIDFFLRVFEKYKNEEVVIWQDKNFCYSWLLEQIDKWRKVINDNNVTSGTVVSLQADFSPNSVALFLALIDKSCVIVPITNSVEAKKNEFIKTAEVEMSFHLDGCDDAKITRLNNKATHRYYQALRQLNHAGLVLFSSGSTGESKAVVHDLTKLLEKFKTERKRQRTITFLLYDHIGGINTMFYVLSNGGCVITVLDRSPNGVLGVVEKHKVDLLPTTPTFINLILLSEAYKRYDLSSLKIITYGTEPMPESTLKRFHQILPHVTLQQTYGLSELGILRSKSKSSDSLWVKIGGEGFETRIIDGILQIKANSAMLGYLNAPSPFTEDGWLNTGDAVEVDGEYIKILGRKSDIINVGGEKVYPAEVENIIHQMDNVAEVTVYGEKNPIVGSMVSVRVCLINEEPQKDFIVRLKRYCRQRLQNYKVPVKVTVVDKKQYSDRFKKIRKIN